MLRICAVVSLALVACAPRQDQAQLSSKLGVKDWNTLQMRLSRGICYGTCPRYELEILGDGTVTYCGLAYVREVGERTRTISREDVRMLADKFAESKFLDLKSEYMDGPTDGSTFGLWLSYDGREKSVLHYSGSEEGTLLLGALEKAIDQAGGTAEWIGADEGTLSGAVPDCARKFGIEPPQPMPPAPF